MNSFQIQLGINLGWQDVKQAYRRSAFGPFWITAGMAVQIATMALVFGLIFKSDLHTYLPFVATSVILWGLISNSLSDGCLVFISNEAIIRQLKLPFLVYVVRLVAKNILTLLHNLVLLPILFIAVSFKVSWSLVLFLPGLALVVLNIAWMAVILGTVSARFRDVPPIVSSLLTVAFYLTPVMWYPSLIGNSQVSHFLLGLNPFYHLLQLVRLPVLNMLPTAENWLVSIGLLIFGGTLSMLVLAKFRKKIALWV